MAESVAGQISDALVRLWREAFEYGVGVTDPHPLAEQRDAFVGDVPARGQHTEQVLGEFGNGAAEIAAMRASGAI